MLNDFKMKKVSIGAILNHVFFLALSVCFIIPILSVISISLSREDDILDYGYQLWPKNISFDAYSFVLKNSTQIIDSYKITIIISSVGTIISVLFMLMCAYVLARKTFSFRSILSFFLFFTMLFQGGMVPSYILVTQYLHLNNNILILILSGLVNVWYIFILRTFIQDIPESIIESGLIDGAKEFRVFVSLIVPISLPSIATIGLFVLLGYWNSWMPALLYISKPKLYPLQYLLQRILQNLEESIKNMDKMPAGSTTNTKVPSETVRMVMAVLAAGPMLVVLPFFQKYFVRGMTVGAVKG